MNDFQKSLDRYLTTEPVDSYSVWHERVVESFTDYFYNNFSDWILEYDGQCDRWLTKLYADGCDPDHAAKVIERIHRRFSKQ